jgi:hypothetical protein
MTTPGSKPKQQKTTTPTNSENTNDNDIYQSFSDPHLAPVIYHPKYSAAAREM